MEGGGNCGHSLTLAPDEAQDAVGRGGPRAEGRIDLVRLQEVQQLQSVDHGNGLGSGGAGPAVPCTGRLGVEAGQDVGVVRAGQGYDHVLAGHAGLLQNRGVGDVAQVDGHPTVQFVGQLVGPFLLLLDYGHVEAALDQRFSQHLGCPAAAQEECPGGHVMGQAHPGRDVPKGTTLADHGE